MWALLGSLIGGITGAVGKMLPDRSKQNEAQGRINEAINGSTRQPCAAMAILLGLDALPAFWLGGGRAPVVIPMFFPTGATTCPRRPSADP